MYIYISISLCFLIIFLPPCARLGRDRMFGELSLVIDIALGRTSSSMALNAGTSVAVAVGGSTSSSSSSVAAGASNDASPSSGGDDESSGSAVAKKSQLSSKFAHFFSSLTGGDDDVAPNAGAAHAAPTTTATTQRPAGAKTRALISSTWSDDAQPNALSRDAQVGLPVDDCIILFLKNFISHC
jgi:hypothetical protein